MDRRRLLRCHCDFAESCPSAVSFAGTASNRTDRCDRSGQHDSACAAVLQQRSFRFRRQGVGLNSSNARRACYAARDEWQLIQTIPMQSDNRIRPQIRYRAYNRTTEFIELGRLAPRPSPSPAAKLTAAQIGSPADTAIEVGVLCRIECLGQIAEQSRLCRPVVRRDSAVRC